MSANAKQGRVGIDLTQGSILRGLLIFAVPIILTNLIQQLYSLVDLIVIGQFMGNIGTVGVSTGGEISDMLTPIATAFATAGQIYIAQRAGAKNEEKMRSAIGTTITSMLLISLIFTVGTLVFYHQILTLLNCPEEAFGQASAYMIITCIGMPFIFGYNAVCGVLRGLGESKAPMWFIIIAAVSNIILDIILVAVFNLEAAGTAIATIAAQIASFIAAAVYMVKHKEDLNLELNLATFKPNWEDFKVIMSQAIPQALRSTLVRFGMLWVNANVNAYGMIPSGTNNVGNKLQKFLDVGSTSLAQASSAMVGQNLGARQTKRAKQTVLYAFASSLVVSSVIALVCVIFPKPVFRIFTTDLDVMEMGVIYLRIMVFQFLLSAVTSSFQSMIIGCGHAPLNFTVGILDGIVCKIGLSMLFAWTLGMGAIGFFWGTALSRAIPGVICVAYFFSGRWETRKLLGEKSSQRS